MKKISNDKLQEKDLYRPVRDYLAAQGYCVYGEVKNCDITAVKEDELIAVELKKSFNATLLIQATQRQKAADSVYVAVPRPKGGLRNRNWQHISHLLRRLELGLIFVYFYGDKADVEIVFHPAPFDRIRSQKQNKNVRYSIIKEIEGRYGDFNAGGSTRTKLMTAYRESSIRIACCLEKLGPLSPKKLKNLGTGPKTQSILSKNFYGWFIKVDKGVYSLSEQGKTELSDYPVLVEHYNQELEQK